MLEVNIICGTYQTCQKKARGYKNEQFFFLQFWFCAISESKLSEKKTISKILFFESISVVISQKLSELDQFNIVHVFFPSTVVGCSKVVNALSNFFISLPADFRLFPATQKALHQPKMGKNEGFWTKLGR